jgi:single-strand DNA-binding protein
MNIVVLEGKLSRAPEVRVLPSESVLVTYDVTTSVADGPVATAPVAWFDPPRDLPDLAKGDDVTVVGHVRRRFFQAGGGLQSRTEVVAEVVVPSRNARRARTAVERALARARPE